MVKQFPPSQHSAEFESPSDMPTFGLDRKAFRVWSTGIPFDCYLRKKQGGSDRLFVMLHGAIRRGIHTPPIFARWDWTDKVDGHILAISDPTLGFSDATFISWYLGDVARNPIPGLCEIAGAVASRVKAEPIFYGSSAGGFGAIAAACHSGGKAIAINPQTDVAAYGRGMGAMARLFGVKSGEEARSKFPERWLAVNLVKAAWAAGKSPRLVIAQNQTDTEHLHGHLTPFCTALGVPSGGSADGITTHIYSEPGGHNTKESLCVVKALTALV